MRYTINTQCAHSYKFLVVLQRNNWLFLFFSSSTPLFCVLFVCGALSYFSRAASEKYRMKRRLKRSRKKGKRNPKQQLYTHKLQNVYNFLFVVQFVPLTRSQCGSVVRNFFVSLFIALFAALRSRMNEEKSHAKTKRIYKFIIIWVYLPCKYTPTYRFTFISAFLLLLPLFELCIGADEILENFSFINVSLRCVVAYMRLSFFFFFILLLSFRFMICVVCALVSGKWK